MNIKKQAISGVKWTTVSTVTLSLTALLRISILARFLDKTDFGLMAMIVFVMGFMNLFMDMGLTIAILHKQNITRNEYASLYWINFLFSIILFILLLIATPLIASFYSQKELLNLLPLMGLGLIISALGKQFKTIEQKELHFKLLAIVDIISSMFSLGVATFFAVKGFGVYALVYSALTLYAVSNITLLFIGISQKRLFFHFNFKETIPFLKIGIYQTGSDFTNYLNRDIDVLIIGKLLGAEILGGYSLAKQLARRPLQIIDPIITKVIISVFPRFQNDNNKLIAYFKRILTGIALIDALVYGSIAIMAPLVVRILYGPGYEDIVLNVQLFTIVVYLRSLTGQQGVLVITKGRTDLGFFWNILLTLVFPLVIYLGSLKSVSYVIGYLIILHLILLIPSWKMFYKNLIGMPLWSFLKPILLPLLLTGFVFLVFISVTNINLFYQILFSFILTITLAVYAWFQSEDFRSIILKIRK